MTAKPPIGDEWPGEPQQDRAGRATTRARGASCGEGTREFQRSRELLAEDEVFFDAMTVANGGHPVPSPCASMKLGGFPAGRAATASSSSSRVGHSELAVSGFFDFVRSADPE